MPISYRPLVDFLAAHPPETVRITLPLSEIEALLGLPLPATVWASSWWAWFAHHRTPRPWVRAGWRVSRVAMRSPVQAVTFERMLPALMSHPCVSPG